MKVKVETMKAMKALGLQTVGLLASYVASRGLTSLPLEAQI